jgi:hypothetical protein
MIHRVQVASYLSLPLVFFQTDVGAVASNRRGKQASRIKPVVHPKPHPRQGSVPSFLITQPSYHVHQDIQLALL